MLGGRVSSASNTYRAVRTCPGMAQCIDVPALADSSIYKNITAQWSQSIDEATLTDSCVYMAVIWCSCPSKHTWHKCQQPQLETEQQECNMIKLATLLELQSNELDWTPKGSRAFQQIFKPSWIDRLLLRECKYWIVPFELNDKLS